MVIYQLDGKFCQVSGGHCENVHYESEDTNQLEQLRSSAYRTYSGWIETIPLTMTLKTEIINTPTTPPPTIPDTSTFKLIELEIGNTILENFRDIRGNDTLAHALAISSDFHRQVSELCALTGYELKQIYQLYIGQVRIVVEQKGSWSILKLIAAIIGIAILVLLAIFSGSVILGIIGLVGGFIAIHFVVRSFINEDLVQEGVINQQEAASNLKDLIPEIQNNPNLTEEQKSNLIQALYEKILQIEAKIGAEPPTLPPVFPPAPGGESNLGKVLDLVPVLIVGGLAMVIFSQMRKK